jgi:HEXXH motif-containing protein
MHLYQADPTGYFRTGFADEFNQVVAGDHDSRRRLMGSSATLAWLNLSLAELYKIQQGHSTSHQRLRRLLRDFGELRARMAQIEAHSRKVSGTQILVQGHDIDPLIAKVTPPSYRFGKADPARPGTSNHAVAFFADVVSHALRRIDGAWSECCARIVDAVQIIGYLPDAGFRSCSAGRYAGVIYLAARDESLLDLEESLVHEAGHQLLYMIANVQHLTRDNEQASRMYVLPWSGRTRNLYGYLHAFYIYVLLALYFERVAVSESDLHSLAEKTRAHQRMLDIHSGVRRAVRDLNGNTGLTAEGKRLVNALAARSDELEDRLGSHRRGPVADQA